MTVTTLRFSDEVCSNGPGIVQDLLREEGLGRFAFRGIKVKGDKLTRALSWANRAEAGKVVLVRGRWTEAFLDEVCRFPHGPHDDQIDAISLAVSMMDFRKREVYAF